jgi:hypothetical protein
LPDIEINLKSLAFSMLGFVAHHDWPRNAALAFGELLAVPQMLLRFSTALGTFPNRSEPLRTASEPLGNARNLQI